MATLRPLEMQRVSLRMLRDDAAGAALLLADSGAFEPDDAEIPRDALNERPSAHYAEVHASATARLQKIEGAIGAVAPDREAAPRVVPLAELEAVDARLGAAWRDFFALEERLHRLAEERDAIVATRESLARFAALDVDLGRLRRPGEFLSLHVGTVPRGQRRHLDQAASLAGHFATTFHETETIEYVIVLGPAERRDEVMRLLSAADFRPLEIPEAFRDHPDRVDRDLAERLAAIERESDAERARLAALVAERGAALARDAALLAFAAPYAALGTSLRAQGGLALIEGWVPAERVSPLEESLRSGLGSPFTLAARGPKRDERARVPTLMRHGRLLGPFAGLVRGYGLPRYREIDPTVMLAISYVLLFGMMFGDVGQGAVLVLAGFIAAPRRADVGIFLVACGGASVLFGFMYGSVFGYEEVIHPLWVSPLSDPMLLLRVALVCGITLILIANVASVINLLDEGERAAALFSSRGLAGSALYVAGLATISQWLDTGSVSIFAAGPAVLAFAVVIGWSWHETRVALGERLIVTVVESYETIIGYVSNTLSFLRIAAFSLNHVALSIAVFTIANSLERTGYLVTVVLGNVFILVLEGGIVIIQVLRLEYYEGFSRFFHGDGRPFRPLRLAQGPT